MSDIVPYTPHEETCMRDLVGTAKFESESQVAAIEKGTRTYPDGVREDYQRLEFR